MKKVYLVGAGPGDPELITWKGRRLLESADAVLYDNLASRVLLQLAPAGAELLYVGKKKAEQHYSQQQICQMMVERARAGKTVVRLKGGDPLTFGRGGEEAEALFEAGVDFEIVPGVTTPAGIAAYSGVPLTHREHTSVLTFLTGHDIERIDWRRVSGAQTLVLFMGLTQFAEIARLLIENGQSPETPALAVRWATRPDQQAVAGTLSDLPGKIREAGLRPPVTLVVGSVVSLRDKLNWFERLPLFGQRVVITRARRQASKLAQKLRSLGADVIEFPTIEVQPLDDYTALDSALARLATYDWLVFTSVNGVEFFLRRLDASDVDWRVLRARICAIGPATRLAVEDLHLKVDVMPEEYVAESLLAAKGWTLARLAKKLSSMEPDSDQLQRIRRRVARQMEANHAGDSWQLAVLARAFALLDPLAEEVMSSEWRFQLDAMTLRETLRAARRTSSTTRWMTSLLSTTDKNS